MMTLIIVIGRIFTLSAVLIKYALLKELAPENVLTVLLYRCKMYYNCNSNMGEVPVYGIKVAIC